MTRTRQKPDFVVDFVTAANSDMVDIDKSRWSQKELSLLWSYNQSLVQFRIN